MDIIKKGFGSRLKIVRKLKNYTQEKLAEDIGINLRQLARIEAGESFVTSETLVRICSVLEISPYVLFDFDIQEDVLMTGTGESVHFSVIKSGNILQLVPTENKTQNYSSLSENFDDKMREMAKRVKKALFVDEISDGKVLQTKIFKPNGEVEIINKNGADELFSSLKEKISKISNDNKKIEFMNLAYDALTNKDALNELKILIKGIELTL